MRNSIPQTLRLGLAALVTVSAASVGLAQSVAPSLAGDLEELARLTASVRTKAEAEARFRQLRATAPSDARVPYTYALLLIERKRYQDASEPLKEALRLDGGNLDAWKTRIWLSVLMGDHDDALATMERLAQRMPAPPISSECERKCREFAGFMGQVFGYLSGPGKERLDAVQQTSYHQAITSHLTDACYEVFESLSQRVIEDYSARMGQIEGLSEYARQREADYRNLQMESAAQDRDYTWREQSRLEDLRVVGRSLAANERNVIAATRERVRAGFSSIDGSQYRDAQEIGPLYRVDPDAIRWDPNRGRWAIDANAQWQLDHLADRYQGFDQIGEAGGHYFKDRGLGDIHYANVNVREQEYHNYLVKREKRLNHRQRRIAQDTARLLRRPVVGNTPELMCQKTKATALTTYVLVPVSPKAEIQRVLASYRNS